MFGIDAPELLVIVVVAILVIGPKDLPLALRTAGRWIGKVRRVSNHFRTGLESMIREAEMEEMEKKWKAQNEEIIASSGAVMTPINSETMAPVGLGLPAAAAEARVPPPPEGEAETPPPVGEATPLSEAKGG